LYVVGLNDHWIFSHGSHITNVYSLYSDKIYWNTPSLCFFPRTLLTNFYPSYPLPNRAPTNSNYFCIEHSLDNFHNSHLNPWVIITFATPNSGWKDLCFYPSPKSCAGAPIRILIGSRYMTPRSRVEKA
jgi:hypothetical protein